MSAQLPDFDPYELLGVDASADAATVDKAYKARIRHVHPDIAGITGLDESKRLNIAREWLLDPDLRAQLPPPARRWGRFARRKPEAPPPPPPGPSAAPPPPPPPPRASTDTDWYWEGKAAPPPRPSYEYDPDLDDPLAFDFGAWTDELRAFFGAIRGLTADERARVTYSLGEEPPMLFDDFKHLVSERMWARSRALADAVEQVWRERVDEGPPLLFPRGRVFGNGIVVANAYAQWRLLGEAIAQRTRDPLSMAALETRCTAPWAASVGHDRLGSHQDDVIACLDDARRLTLPQAERLSKAWERDMGGFLYGRPGEDWFPGSLDHVRPDLVSARLAAVDASRIEPPDAMPYDQRNGFRCGLRLTAYVLALGGVSEAGRDYLRPWKEALNPNPSFADRARWGMPQG
ncbi:MAG: DnaJ domain-containing protein [Chloroflexota bacterium]